MVIKIGSITAINCGSALSVEGDANLEVGPIHAESCRGDAVKIFKHASLMEQLGLPKETDPKELAHFLIQVSSAPNYQKEEVIKASGLWGKFKTGAVETTTLLANIISIANSPQLLNLVTELMK